MSSPQKKVRKKFHTGKKKKLIKGWGERCAIKLSSWVRHSWTPSIFPCWAASLGVCDKECLVSDLYSSDVIGTCCYNVDKVSMPRPETIIAVVPLLMTLSAQYHKRHKFVNIGARVSHGLGAHRQSNSICTGSNAIHDAHTLEHEVYQDLARQHIYRCRSFV